MWVVGGVGSLVGGLVAWLLIGLVWFVVFRALDDPAGGVSADRGGTDLGGWRSFGGKGSEDGE